MPFGRTQTFDSQPGFTRNGLNMLEVGKHCSRSLAEGKNVCGGCVCVCVCVWGGGGGGSRLRSN